MNPTDDKKLLGASEEILRRIEKDINTAKFLRERFYGYTKACQTMLDHEVIMERTLLDVATKEETKPASELFQSAHSAYNSTRLEHQKALNQTFLNTIVPYLDGYPTSIPKLKDTLERFRTKSQDDQKKKSNLDAAPTGQKRDALQAAYKESQNQLAVHRENTKQQLMKYHQKRSKELKVMMQHLVNAELYYHAKALENFTKLADAINKFDDNADANDILKKYIEVAEQPVRPSPSSSNMQASATGLNGKESNRGGTIPPSKP